MSYSSFDKAIEIIKEAREFQATKWPDTERENAGDRPLEEWLLLLNRYVHKMNEVYAETPETNRDGSINYEGKRRIRKYVAILANLAVWGIQSVGDIE